MTDKEKKSKIADILLEFYDEYQCNMPNRPMIPRLYASKIIDSLQEEPISDVWHNASEKPERDDLLIETNDGRIIHRQSINNYGMVKRWAYTSDLLNLDNSCNLGNNSQEEPVSDDLKKAHWNAAIKYDSKIPFGEYLFRAGVNWKREQMMKGATEAIVKVDAGGYPYIPQIELYDYNKDVPLAKDGDKYKIILIKEE